MANHIVTYFYNDLEELGAVYGNISLPLHERNLVYWQTIYTFYFSSYINNRDHNVVHILFTNIRDFPFRAQIENFGVKVYDNLLLSFRNKQKWATVKFFFDVINYIEASEDFKKDDAFIMLDTDVLAQHSSKYIFDYINSNLNPVVYINARNVQKSGLLHGVSVARLENICRDEFNNTNEIYETVGGEFFGFRKGHIGDVLNSFKKILMPKYELELTTEEQILTITHSVSNFSQLPHAIIRVWTSLSFMKIPKHISRFTFIHLPSEKQDGLNKLFNYTKSMSVINLSTEGFEKLLYKCIPLKNIVFLYILKISARVTLKYLKRSS